MNLEQNQLFANRYRLIKEQGRGSFGEVWLAQDEQLDMQVAVKVYIALDDRGIEEFKKEYKTAYKLNHPNLLHAYHFDICDKRPFLVMPYCPDSALSLIGDCDADTLRRFIKDVSSGLAYLHSLDTVHHDIKPDNILRTEDGSFVITDFGISTKMRSTLRRNSTRAMNNNPTGGSLPYMGPEMFSAKPESVKATDIWAFGVTLCEIITGDLPFFGKGGVMQLNGASIPEFEYEDPEIVKLVMACMSKNPWDRPTAEALLHSLANGSTMSSAKTESERSSDNNEATQPLIETKGTPPKEGGYHTIKTLSLTSISKVAIIICILLSTFCVFPGLFIIGILGPIGGLMSIAGCIVMLNKKQWGYFLCCFGGAIAALQFAIKLLSDYMESPEIWGFLVIMVYFLFPIIGMSILQIESSSSGLCSWEVMSLSQHNQSEGKPRKALSKGDSYGLANILGGNFLKISSILLIVSAFLGVMVFATEDATLGDSKTVLLFWVFSRLCYIGVFSFLFIRLLKGSKTTMCFTLGLTGALFLLYWTLYRTMSLTYIASLVEYYWVLYSVPLFFLSAALLFILKYLRTKSISKVGIMLSSLMLFLSAISGFLPVDIWYPRVFQTLAYVMLAVSFRTLLRDSAYNQSE